MSPVTLSPDPVMRRVHACVEAGVPVVLWDDPGTGKTARLMTYARARGFHIERWLLSRCEPIDLKPRIYADGKVIVSRPPEIDALLSVAAKKTGRKLGMLFTDELNRATRETEGAALDIIDNPPDGVAVVAACNPPSRGQASRSLEAAAANRFCHLEVPLDPAAWAHAQVNGWSADASDFPSVDATALSHFDGKARMLISAFIQREPALLKKVPDNPVQAGKAWPSPRTWEHARKLYATARALGLDTDDALALVSGCVGEGAGTEWITFCTYADLVDPEEWLANPTGFMPDRVDKIVAALSSVAHAVKSKLTEARWRAAWKIVDHVVASEKMDGAMVGGDLLVHIYRSRDLDKKTRDSLPPPHKVMNARMAQLLVGP